MRASNASRDRRVIAKQLRLECTFRILSYMCLVCTIAC